MAALKAPPLPASLTADLVIFSPREHEVVQRQSESHGRVLLSGHAIAQATRLEARIIGQSRYAEVSSEWREVPFVQGTGSFNSEWAVPAGGWYRLEVRALRDGEVLAEATVERFGVGEVFVGAGQSLSTNSGPRRTQQTSGMVASFSGADWRLADDPQPGAHDQSQGGSCYPAFGDALYRRDEVPIGVAVTGHGGTSVNQWQPEGELFAWMMARLHQLGRQGFRAVLWQQGSADTQMEPEEYFGKLRRVILTSKEMAGWEFPWFVAKHSYTDPDHPMWPKVREGQQRLWDARVALEGPDTDALTGDHRYLDGDKLHFVPKGLNAQGRLWAEKASVHLEKILR